MSRDSLFIATLPLITVIPLSPTPPPSRNITGATFTLKWNVMPKVGILAYGDEAQTGSIEVPKKVLPVEGEKRIKPEKMWF